ncbi:MAG: Fic family protein [Myxococcales bacterium]|nr:Fic family protein [Myxococcales bacterium]
MDPRRFSARATGELLEIVDPVRDWSFVPHPLPPTWEPPPPLLRLLADAMQELGRLDGAGQLVANSDLILRPLRRREALKSSSLEGTIATAEELLLYEVDSDASSADVRGDVREVGNYAAALDLGFRLLTELPLCERLIRNVHERLLEGVRGGDRRPGEFRRTQVHLGVDRRYVPPPPDRLPTLLRALEHAMNDGRPQPIPPLIWCFLVHYQFEAIHPFTDGNGRVGRVLLAMMISSFCELQRPWLYLSPWFDRHRADYIDRMFGVSTNGDWDGWVEFCLKGTIAQARDGQLRLRALMTLQQEFRARVAASTGAARLGRLVEDLFDIVPVVTVPWAARRLGVSYPTAKKDLELLEQLGILRRYTASRPLRFASWDIIRIGMDDT